MVFIKKHKKYLITSGLVWAACLVLFLIVYFIIINPQNRQKKHIENELEKRTQKYEYAQRAAQEETRNKFFTTTG